MSNQWERFQRGLFSRGSEPTVKIGKAGHILINGLAYKLIDGAEYVQLYFNRPRRLIGICRARQSDPDVYRLGKSGKKSHQINARSFLKHYKLEDKLATAHRPKYEDGMIVLNLNGGWERAPK